MIFLRRFIRISRPCASFTAGIFLSLAIGLRADLTERSPFLPPDFGETGPDSEAPAAPANVNNLQFKGYYELGGVQHFNLFDPQTDRGHWVRLNQVVNGVRVTSFDPANRSVNIVLNGDRYSLALASPTDSAGGASSIGRATSGPTRSTAGPVRRPTVQPRVIAPPRPGGGTVNRPNVVPRRVIVRPADRAED